MAEMALRWNESCRPTSSKAAPAAPTDRVTRRPTRPTAAIRPFPQRALQPSCELLRDQREVQRRHDEVGEEDEDEGDDHGLIDRVAHTLRPALGVEALVTSDHGGDEPEDE